MVNLFKPETRKIHNKKVSIGREISHPPLRKDDIEELVNGISSHLNFDDQEKSVLFYMAYTMDWDITFNHSVNVYSLAHGMSECLGHGEILTRQISKVALVHDVGKISIAKELLLKKGKPTAEELKILKSHVLWSSKYLINTSFEECLSSVIAHHENKDGSGYPNGLKNCEIPYPARIVRVADSYQAATANRGYNKPLSPELALEDIKSKVDLWYDEACVNALEDLLISNGEITPKQKTIYIGQGKYQIKPA